MTEQADPIGTGHSSRASKRIDGDIDPMGRLRRWRSEQPFGWDFRTWTTANGGYVMQLGQVRVFYGRCPCGALVTTRRGIEHLDSRLGTGAWPKHCQGCAAARTREHDAGAAERMRRLRAGRYADRDAQFRELGIPLPKPRGRRSA